MSKPEIELVKG